MLSHRTYLASSFNTVDPLSEATRKDIAQSKDKPVSERKLRENEIVKLVRTKAAAELKLRDEMKKVQQQVEACNPERLCRQCCLEGTDAKGLGEDMLLPITCPANESIGLRLQIAGSDAVSAIVKAEGDAPAPSSSGLVASA
ncbi:hypothetical protein FRB94_001414 [Tulasnella sp. JGI-2019a]|nr:hypothetical protein FRB94_001414 [Tulasnella sp. JGI-2019a]KAG9003443.1 hypothetical protein FRB93_011067 [Tulasnella sp. JGI-2019a]KAG9028621.1 hypothetical protein FRB95_006299 [Tulasnella sp. JGI-2019a]